MGSREVPEAPSPVKLATGHNFSSEDASHTMAMSLPHEQALPMVVSGEHDNSGFGNEDLFADNELAMSDDEFLPLERKTWSKPHHRRYCRSSGSRVSELLELTPLVCLDDSAGLGRATWKEDCATDVALVVGLSSQHSPMNLVHRLSAATASASTVS